MRSNAWRRAFAPVAAIALVAATSACGREDVDIGFPEQPAPVLAAQMTFAPHTGAPGTPVTVTAEGFLANQPVVVGFGPPESEYEVIERVTTNAQGAVTTTVEVPDWAEPGRSYVWVVAEPGVQMKAIADDRFMVVEGGAAPGDTVRIRGTFTGEGVECPAIRTDRGRLYTLAAGDLSGVGEGDRVVVTGTLAEVSTCMQGTTIAVTRIEKVR